MDSNNLKMLKKVDDTLKKAKAQNNKAKKPIAKPNSKKQSKKVLKLLPGQVPIILFSKS